MYDSKYGVAKTISGTEFDDGYVSYSKSGLISKQSHDVTDIDVKESFLDITSNSENNGYVNPDTTYRTVKSEATALMDDYEYTFTEPYSQVETETEMPADSRARTLELEVPPLTVGQESIAEPAISEAEGQESIAEPVNSEPEESAIFLASVNSYDADPKYSEVVQQTKSQTALKSTISITGRKREKKTATPFARTESSNNNNRQSEKAHAKLVPVPASKIKTVKSVEKEPMVNTTPQMKKTGSRRQSKESFFCDICQWTFKRKTTYDMHLMYDRCTLRCRTCGKLFAFRNKNGYETHLKRHKKQYDYKCEDCGRQFIDKYKLLKHQQCIHNKDNPYKCEECFKRFPSESDLVLHKATNHNVEGKYPCPKCRKVFEKPRPLSEHLKFNHLIGADPCLPCSVCGKFYNARYLPIHEKLSHKKTKDYKCGQCPSAFITQVDLRNHTKRHTKSYSEYCETCGKGCYCRAELKNHKRIHTGEKPFACTLCDYRCAIKSNLLKHMKVHNKFE